MNRLGNVARKTEYNGKTYHSAFEAEYAQYLDILLKAKQIKSWRGQIRMPLDVNKHHICNYIVDFEVTNNDGSITYIEVKGYETDVWRMKWKLFEALYGDKFTLTVVKQTPKLWRARNAKKKKT